MTTPKYVLVLMWDADRQGTAIPLASQTLEDAYREARFALFGTSKDWKARWRRMYGGGRKPGGCLEPTYELLPDGGRTPLEDEPLAAYVVAVQASINLEALRCELAAWKKTALEELRSDPEWQEYERLRKKFEDQ